ncbi:putative serine protease PepD [Stackebrandtia albiflava]|uniref:Putative serine protease PepD n=1 Tax=Stackebrandtia albiflava TaxID=406432 RepID=A0A562UPG9_9ACTN|nr:trypsin-like peptidase domain-containing protein [Stackebrandtia albiflava]TWJ07514.1 putative serine protease PepD [Stackebrandtia albiflava]
MVDGNPQPNRTSGWAAPSTDHPAQPRQPYQPPAPATSPWWAKDAATDPWRDPAAPAVVRHTPPPVLPPTEPPAPPEPAHAPTTRLVVVIAVVTALLAGGIGAALAVYATSSGRTGVVTQPNTDRPAGSYQDIISQLLPSVVTIWVDSDEGGGNGSGFVYSSEGYIVTNQHVANLADADGARMTVQFNDGTEIPAEVVGGAESTDIAVIKVDRTGLPAVAVADSNDLVVGDPVIAIGAPLGLSHTVTDGIVSALDRPVVAGESERDSTVTAAIQTDAAINPGNSGGPLVDAGGALVGVVSSIYTIANEEGEGGSIGLGFAIPSNQVVRIASELIDTGEATRTELGVSLEQSRPGVPGAQIESVDSGGPAAEAGITEGDVIRSINGTPVLSDVHLRALVLKYGGGDTVTIGYERDGETAEAQVTLRSVPDN